MSVLIFQGSLKNTWIDTSESKFTNSRMMNALLGDITYTADNFPEDQYFNCSEKLCPT